MRRVVLLSTLIFVLKSLEFRCESLVGVWMDREDIYMSTSGNERRGFRRKLIAALSTVTLAVSGAVVAPHAGAYVEKEDSFLSGNPDNNDNELQPKVSVNVTPTDQEVQPGDTVELSSPAPSKLLSRPAVASRVRASRTSKERQSPCSFLTSSKRNRRLTRRRLSGRAARSGTLR